MPQNHQILMSQKLYVLQYTSLLQDDVGAEYSQIRSQLG